MERKLPPEAYEYYLSLGLKRSYVAVAKQYGVSKAAVTSLAAKERWQERIRDSEAKARATTDKKQVESMEEIRERHLRSARLMQAKALETLRTMRLEDAMSAVKALDLGMRNERLLLGEPTERSENIELIIRSEHERWQKRCSDEDEWADLLEDPKAPDASPLPPPEPGATGAGEGTDGIAA